ncbi:hypothetical protein BRC65_06435 [Halobacteriales archaeon QH_2_65_14]|nr:MAG: hypothetical protein BRC65_06435 [Halobacteriales archaeon QH_2_65_14]
MRRDHFTVAVRNVDAGSAGVPTLDIEYDGQGGGDLYTADEIDAAFRLQEPLDADDTTGVFSLTHRITGEYLLEVNVEAEAVLDLVRGARDSEEEEDASYHVGIEREADEPINYEMDALLVYDDGNLLRQRSLIPSGVEL